MTTTAEVVLDSINEKGVRLTTLKLRYPRVAIHAQLLMHREWSRSCSSARAIPVKTMLGEVMSDPVMFEGLAFNQPGMQPGEELDEETKVEALRILEEHRNFSVLCAQKYLALGIHKQWANRFIEMHSHISVVVTATSFDNFLHLRLKKGDDGKKEAQEEIYTLAREIHTCLTKSTPTVLKDGEWHIPFITDRDFQEYPIEKLLLISAARCARTSYNKHDNTAPIASEDLNLAGKLAMAAHWNPFEHQARADSLLNSPDHCGNFREGWYQHRKLLADIEVR